jgi:superfamily II DNA or RNA helicase
LEIYTELSYEIGKCWIEKDGKPTMSERGKRLALKRSRIVAGAKDKLVKLNEVITPFKDESYLLVYCGAAKVISDNDDKEDGRQIELVSKQLYDNFGMRTARFTSNEDMATRKTLKEQFASGELQALVAIRCLDEGVNIPAIRRAFILASTTNPKEYIQRRGRVLRLYPGKEFAYIYDFITLPRPLANVHYLTEQQHKMELSLVKNELKRAEEFAKLANNMPIAKKVIDNIKEAYSINEHLINEKWEYV